MKNNKSNETINKRWLPVLSAAGAAASVALVWGGLSAIEAVSTPDAGATLNAARVGEEQPAVKDAPAPAGHDPKAPGHAPAAPGGTPPGQAMAAEKTPPTVGGKSEVSLAKAGEAQAGLAAGPKSGAKDRSAGLKQRGAVSPADVLRGKEISLGGCLPQYGADGQCLPAIPPSLGAHVKQMKDAGADPAAMPHSWTCAEVREYFADGLPVRKAKVDPQKLDVNKDGTACGPGD